MRKLDQRGAAAFEFCLVAVPLFTLIFAIFDFGRYTITMQSLRILADAGARANMVTCYSPAVLASNSPSTCTGDYLTTTQKQTVAPFLYGAGLTPTVTTTAGTSALTVTASLPGFSPLMPVWGTSLNSPTASTQIPF
ncbi:TadE/TadG family type IV pilus assembly protein [Bradyrhizobium acaciae]|uniref:TadE/TadG family type IV pilus assembly protein n=1 Tax=Bradyrhizobium acaciae TaxID=2683706 RepID=UPI001E4D0545|nr:TadE family protein [Bradyrhizobium acaciae]